MADLESRILTIRSGGQTGVDRAALDVAVELGLPVTGWCPQGRRAEDGVIPRRYPLTETASRDPAERTRLNVRDADATLILRTHHPSPGTDLTEQVARELQRSLYVVMLGEEAHSDDIAAWIRHHDVRDLNIAGPRASEAPGAYREAARLLREVLARAGTYVGPWRAKGWKQ